MSTPRVHSRIAGGNALTTGHRNRRDRLATSCVHVHGTALCIRQATPLPRSAPLPISTSEPESEPDWIAVQPAAERSGAVEVRARADSATTAAPAASAIAASAAASM